MRKSNTLEFVQKAIKIHGQIYDYDKVDYKKSNKPVQILCKKHNEYFYPTPNNHLRGGGCSLCGDERTKIAISKYAKENTVGWTRKQWRNKAEKSKNFDSFKVYIIRCWNDTETFFKIGKTFATIQRRFQDKNTMPYNYEIVKIIESVVNSDEIYDLEVILKKQHKAFKYLPKQQFSGRYECFSTISLTDCNKFVKVDF